MAQTIVTDGWGLDRGSAVPAYEQIAERLVTLVRSGRLAVGDRLPAERELAAWVGVSRMTARAALARLAERGLVERGVGRGTFVARGKVDHDLRRVAGFTETVGRAGRTATARVSAARQLPCPGPVAGELALAAGTPVLRIERLRYADGEPHALEDSWLPAVRFPGLLGLDLTGSLYAVMRDRYGLAPVRAVERLEPVVAEPGPAAVLGVAPGAPLMLVARVAYAADGVPVEFARDLHRGDRSRFVVEASLGD